MTAADNSRRRLAFFGSEKNINAKKIYCLNHRGNSVINI